MLGVQPVRRPEVLGVTAGNPAEKAGLKRSDVILSVGYRVKSAVAISAMPSGTPWWPSVARTIAAIETKRIA